MIEISIVLPVYGVENYISTCLDSIFSQGLSETKYEVICVDDCSPDRSIEIIQNYQQKHDNLVLVRHDVNKKAGGARNTGLRIAKGKYVWFVDPDDYILENAFQLVLKYCGENDLDVLCFNYFVKQGDKGEIESVFLKSSQPEDGISFLIHAFGKIIVPNLGYPCRAVYKRKTVVDNGIIFVEDVLFGEETTYLAEVVIKSKRVMCIPDPLYCYNQNEQSASSQLFKMMRGDLIYQSIIVAGNEILGLQRKVRLQSVTLADNILVGLPWFLNRLFIRLVRTESHERDRFYDELKAKGEKLCVGLDQIVQFMDIKNRFIVKCPRLGKLTLNVISYIYRIKKQ